MAINAEKASVTKQRSRKIKSKEPQRAAARCKHCRGFMKGHSRTGCFSLPSQIFRVSPTPTPPNTPPRPPVRSLSGVRSRQFLSTPTTPASELQPEVPPILPPVAPMVAVSQARQDCCCRQGFHVQHTQNSTFLFRNDPVLDNATSHSPSHPAQCLPQDQSYDFPVVEYQDVGTSSGSFLQQEYQIDMEYMGINQNPIAPLTAYVYSQEIPIFIPPSNNFSGLGLSTSTIIESLESVKMSDMLFYGPEMQATFQELPLGLHPSLSALPINNNGDVVMSDIDSGLLQGNPVVNYNVSALFSH